MIMRLNCIPPSQIIHLLRNFKSCHNDIIHWYQYNMMQPRENEIDSFFQKIQECLHTLKYSLVDTKLSW